jgi:hypothetical protein
MANYISRPFSNSLTQYDVVNYLRLICHEMTHHRQMYEAKKDMMTKSAYDYISRHLFYGSNFDSDTNYRFRQIEVEAELEGMKQAIRIARLYTPQAQKGIEEVTEQREQLLLERAASIQYAQVNGLFYLTDEYDVRGMVEVVKSHPEVLNKYPQLRVLFDPQTGKVASEEKLLDLYSRSKGGQAKSDLIYEQYLIYLYSNKNVIINTNLPARLLVIKTKFIISELRKEYKYCKQITELLSKPYLIRVSKEFLSNQASNIINLRKNRIILYQEYLKLVNVDANFIELSNELINIYNDTENDLKHYLENNKNDEFNNYKNGGIKL